MILAGFQWSQYGLFKRSKQDILGLQRSLHVFGRCLTRIQRSQEDLRVLGRIQQGFSLSRIQQVLAGFLWYQQQDLAALQQSLLGLQSSYQDFSSLRRIQLDLSGLTWILEVLAGFRISRILEVLAEFVRAFEEGICMFFRRIYRSQEDLRVLGRIQQGFSRIQWDFGRQQDFSDLSMIQDLVLVGFKRLASQQDFVGLKSSQILEVSRIQYNFSTI